MQTQDDPLDSATIQQELEMLWEMQQPRGITKERIELASVLWLSTLGGLGKEDFRLALREHRRQSRYWPTEADILRCHDEVRGRERHQDTDHPAPETNPNGVIMGVMASKALRGNPHAREFFAPGLSLPQREELVFRATGEKVTLQ